MEEFVLHDRDNSRFYLEIEDEVAFILYSKQPDGVLDFFKTYVPDELRNRRLAEKLMKAGIEYARSHQLKIKPSCSYVSHYFAKNPDDAVLIA